MDYHQVLLQLWVFQYHQFQAVAAARVLQELLFQEMQAQMGQVVAADHPVVEQAEQALHQAVRAAMGQP